MKILDSQQPAAGTGIRGWGIRRCAVLAGALMMGGPLLATGQLAMDLHIPSSKALLYESVIARATIHNQSGAIVRFDANLESARFRFEIVMGAGGLIHPLSSAQILSGVELVPGETRLLEFNIPRLYGIQSVGIYKVRAVVDWGGATYASAPAYLEVARGFELRRLTAGVPDDSRASRTYVLEYMQKDTSEENLYLRIEDETAKKIYGMFNLGRLVRVRMPDLQVDESGNVHVLFQAPGTDYIHAAFTPYGVSLATESYPGGNRKIEMMRMPNGRIAVVSGMARPPRAGDGQAGAIPEDGPVTKVKKAAGGLFGKPSE